MKTSQTALFATAVLTTAALLQGCSHAALNKQVDDKVAAESQVKTSADVSSEAKSDIEHDKQLSDDQRVKLLALRKSTRTQLDDLTHQSLRLRAVLVKDLLSRGYDEDEVTLIKKRLREVEDKRVSVIFDSVDQANTILGRDALNHRAMVNDFFETPHGHYN